MYSEEFEKTNFANGPFPMPYSVGGEHTPPNGPAQPRKTGAILKSETDEMPIGSSKKDGNFSTYVQYCGEGLPNSFSLDFTNNYKFSACNVHTHTGILMFALGLNLRPKVIIETGTMYGYSTMYLAKICETWGEGKVYTIDNVNKYAEEETLNNPYIEFIHKDSRIAIPEIIEKHGEVHMAFIDSWKRLAYSEFKLMEPHLVDGAIVCFHDTQYLNTGRSLYNELVKNYSNKYDIMLFSGFAHKENPHKFFGNADDRGLLVLRKRSQVDPFYDAKDWSVEMGARLM